MRGLFEWLSWPLDELPASLLCLFCHGLGCPQLLSAVKKFPVLDSYTINQSVSTSWLFTARPRIGYVYNNWLFYGTGPTAAGLSPIAT